MQNSDDAATTRADRVTGPGAVKLLRDTTETQTDLPSVPGDEAPLAPEGHNPQPEHDDPDPDDQTGSSRAEPSPGGDDEVGYCKPPVHTRFQKGQSGNPSGRPAGRKNILELIAEEAYRMVWDYKVDDMEEIPAIQSVLRAQFKLAVNGHGPAQRAFIKLAMKVAKEELKAEEKRKASERAEANKTESTKTESSGMTPLRISVAHFEKALQSRPGGDTKK